jgi:hypothetical protein
MNISLALLGLLVLALPASANTCKWDWNYYCKDMKTWQKVCGSSCGANKPPTDLGSSGVPFTLRQQAAGGFDRMAPRCRPGEKAGDSCEPGYGCLINDNTKLQCDGRHGGTNGGREEYANKDGQGCWHRHVNDYCPDPCSHSDPAKRPRNCELLQNAPVGALFNHNDTKDPTAPAQNNWFIAAMALSYHADHREGFYSPDNREVQELMYKYGRLLEEIGWKSPYGLCWDAANAQWGQCLVKKADVIASIDDALKSEDAKKILSGSDWHTHINPCPPVQGVMMFPNPQGITWEQVQYRCLKKNPDGTYDRPTDDPYLRGLVASGPGGSGGGSGGETAVGGVTTTDLGGGCKQSTGKFCDAAKTQTTTWTCFSAACGSRSMSGWSDQGTVGGERCWHKITNASKCESSEEVACVLSAPETHCVSPEDAPECPYAKGCLIDLIWPEGSCGDLSPPSGYSAYGGDAFYRLKGQCSSPEEVVAPKAAVAGPAAPTGPASGTAPGGPAGASAGSGSPAGGAAAGGAPTPVGGRKPSGGKIGTGFSDNTMIP